KGLLAFQPQLNVCGIPDPQMIRGAEFMPIPQAFEHAPVGFKLRASVREHTVDRKFRTSPRDLSHHGLCRVVWNGMDGYSSRGGGLTQKGTAWITLCISSVYSSL